MVSEDAEPRQDSQAWDRKMDNYLFSVRRIEQRIAAKKDPRQVISGHDKPSGIPFEFPEYVTHGTYIRRSSQISLAWPVGAGPGRSNRAYPELGISDQHHPLTHHRHNPEWIEKVTRINSLHVELFAYLLQKLKSTTDGDGTLLDHSMFVYGSGLADGNKHTHEALPVLLAGRGGGSLKPVTLPTRWNSTITCTLRCSLEWV